MHEDKRDVENVKNMIISLPYV